jgi:hypothetical protein
VIYDPSNVLSSARNISPQNLIPSQTQIVNGQMEITRNASQQGTRRNGLTLQPKTIKNVLLNKIQQNTVSNGIMRNGISSQRQALTTDTNVLNSLYRRG